MPNDPELEFIVRMRDEATKKAEKLLGRLKQFNRTFTTTISVHVVDKQAIAQLERINRLSGSKKIKVDAETKVAKAKINALDAKIHALTDKPHTIRFRVEANFSKAAIDAAVKQALPSAVKANVQAAAAQPVAAAQPQKLTYKFLHSQVMAAQYEAASLEATKAKAALQGKITQQIGKEMIAKQALLSMEKATLQTYYDQAVTRLKMDKGRESATLRIAKLEELLKKTRADEIALGSRNDLTDKQKTEYARQLHNIRQKLLVSQIQESKSAKANTDHLHSQIKLARTLHETKKAIAHLEAENSRQGMSKDAAKAKADLFLYQEVLRQKLALAERVVGSKTPQVTTQAKDIAIVEKVLTKLKSIPKEIKTKLNYDNFVKFLSVLELITKRMLLISGIVGAIGFAGMGIAIGFMAKKSVDLNSNFELFQTQLRTTLGSLAAAKEEMAEIVKFAKETPYEIQQVVEAVVKLRAYYMDSDVWLKPLGDMAAAFGLPIENAVEAAADAIRGEFRRLRQYGFVFHVSDFRKGGKLAGKTYAEATLEAIESRFKGGMELQAKTMKGIISNIKDTFTISLTEAGKPFYDKIKAMAQELLDWLSKLHESGKFNELVGSLNNAALKAISSIRHAIEWISDNWGPALKTIFTSAMKILGQVMSFVATFVGGPGVMLIKVFLDIAAAVARVAASANVLFKIWIAYKVLVGIMAKLGFQTVALNSALATQGTIFESNMTKVGFMAKRLMVLVAIFALLDGLTKRAQYNQSLDQLGESLGKIAPPKDGLDRYFRQLSKEILVSKIELADAAGVAAKFGDKWQSVLETAARVADDLGMSVEQATELVGELGEKGGMTAEEITTLGKSLLATKEIATSMGMEFDKVMGKILEYPDVLAGLSEGFDGMVAIILAAKKAGVDAAVIFESLSRLLTPTEEMITQLDPSIFITRTTAEAQNLSVVFKQLGEAGVKGFTDLDKAVEDLGNTSRSRAKQIIDNGKAIEEAMADYYKDLGKSDDDIKRMKALGFTFDQVREAIIATRAEITELTEEQQKLRDVTAELTGQLEYLEKQTSMYNIELQMIALEEAEWSNQLAKVNASLDIQKAKLEELNAMEPNGFRDYTDAIFELDQAINNISLGIAYENLAMVSGGILEQSKEVNRLKYEYEAADAALEPLRKHLEGLKDQFDAVNEAMKAAQDTLNGLTNTRFEGDEAYQRQMHDIEKQKKQLQLKLKDAEGTVKNFGDWGHDTDAYKAAAAEVDVINAKLAELEDVEERVRLERELSISDVEFEIGLLADTRPEEAVTSALDKAKKAREEYEAVRPTAEKLAEEVAAAEDRLSIEERVVKAKEDAYNAANSELEAMKAIHEYTIANLELDQQRLSTLKEIAQTEWDISTARFYKAKDEANNGNPTEGNPATILQGIKDINTEIAKIEEKVKFWENLLTTNTARKSELDAKIAQTAIDMARIQTELDSSNDRLNEIENRLAQDDSLIKTLVSNVSGLIQAVEASAFLNGDKTITEAFFGEDMASDIAKITTYREELEKIVALKGQVTGEESGGGTGLGNMLANNPVLKGVLGGAAALGGGLLLKKGVPKLTGGLKNVNMPGGKGKTFGEFFDWRQQEQIAERASKLEKLNTTNLSKIDEIKLTNPSLGATAEEAWAKQYAKLQEAEQMRTLIKTNPELAKQLNINKGTAAQLANGKAPGAVGKALGWFGLGGFATKDVISTVKSAGKGKTFWDKISGGAYSFLKSGNNAEAAVEGLKNPKAVIDRAETLVSGNVQGKAIGGGKSWLQRLLQGGKSESGFIGLGGDSKLKLGKGVKGGALGLLGGAALGGIFSGNLGGAAEGAAQAGGYMATTKVGTSVLSKVLGKGAGKLVPILGQLALVGDVAGLAEGFMGQSIGSAAGKGIEKAGSFLGMKGGGKGLADATKDELDSVLDVCKNASSLLGGVAGSLVGIGKGIFTGDWSYLKESASQLWESLKTIPENVGRAIGNTLRTMMESGEVLLDKITWPFKKAWEWLTEHFQPAAWLDEHVIQPVIGFFSKSWGALKDFLSDPFNNFKELVFGEGGVTSWIGKIIDWFKEIPDWFENTWSSLSTSISAPFKTAWEWVSTNVSSWFTSVVGWLQTIPEWFGDTWNSITEKVKKPFVDAWNWISDTQHGLASWPTKIWNWISSIPTKVKDAFEDLKQMGADLMNKIGEGLANAWESVKNSPAMKPIIWIIEKAGGAVTGALEAVGIMKSHEGEVIGGSATKEHLRILRGQEAVIPLKNGSVPVEFTGGSTYTPSNASNTITQVTETKVNVNEGAFTFIVRDDEDIEVIKQAILDLRKGQLSLVDSPYNYPEGH